MLDLVAHPVTDLLVEEALLGEEGRTQDAVANDFVVAFLVFLYRFRPSHTFSREAFVDVAATFDFG